MSPAATLYTLGLALLSAGFGITIMGWGGWVSFFLGLAGAAILCTRGEPREPRGLP